MWQILALIAFTFCLQLQRVTNLQSVYKNKSIVIDYYCHELVHGRAANVTVDYYRLISIPVYYRHAQLHGLSSVFS
jgi:hypothetical protein